MSKRKKIKLECLNRGSQFDDDRKRHENTVHNGKYVRVQFFGASLNSFEASKKRTPGSSVAALIPHLLKITQERSGYEVKHL